mgnify:CR=1 FL=1
MTLIWNIIQSVITILEIRVCVWMMEKFAEPRYSGKKQKIVVWIVTLGVGVAYAVNRWMAAYYSRTVIWTILGVLCLAAIWLFTYYRWISILVMANYLLISGLLDLAFMSMMELLTQQAGLFLYIEHFNDRYRMGIIILSKSILFIICWIIQRKLNKQVFCQLSKKKLSVICALFCIIEYVGVHVLTAILGEDLPITSDFLIRLIFCLIIIFMFMASMGVVVLYYEKRDQLELKATYLKSLDYENKKMIKLYREREKLYHDFKNHLLILDSFAQSGDLEQYQAYMEQIREPFMQKPLKWRTGNDVLDLILNYKVNEAEEHNIHVKCIVCGYMDFEAELTSEEICSLMGNLWDNAIEACQRLQREKKPWIEFHLSIRNGKLLFEISNSYNEISRDGSGNLQTLKQEKQFHGIGLRAIRSIAERHQGYFDCIIYDHVFKVEVMICKK